MVSRTTWSTGHENRYYGIWKIDTMKFGKSPANVPLRPIVSFVNSPTYNISKFLSIIIKPLMTNRFSVKNSIDFIDRIKDVVIEKDDILVSFDVVSLFTSVPVDCAIKCIFDLLVVDDSLPTRTQLNAHDIKTDREICSNSTVFLTYS